MRVLVIGGTKFLGYHLINSLLEQNIRVTMFNRGVSPNPFSGRVEHVSGDRNDFNKFYELFRPRRFDAVVDLIGYHQEQIEAAVRTFRDHIGRYIFISSGQVYLVTENRHQPAREKDYFQPLISCPPGEEAGYNYGVEKRNCEDLLEKSFKDHGFPSIRLRCPIIHGPRDYTLRLYSYILRINDGQPVIIPEGRDNLIRHVFVKDVARAIVSVLGMDGVEGQAYNLASREVMRLHEFLKIVAGAMNKPLEWREIPLKRMKAYSLDDSISPFSGFWVSYLNAARAEKELGFKPTPLVRWLPETVNWFLSEYGGEPPENYNLREKEIELLERWNEKR